MAEQEDEVGPSRIYGLMECEVEAVPDIFWKLHLGRLDPSLQSELNDITWSDGFQTYMPRVVWLLLCRLEVSRRRKLN